MADGVPNLLGVGETLGEGLGDGVGVTEGDGEGDGDGLGDGDGFDCEPGCRSSFAFAWSRMLVFVGSSKVTAVP